MVPPLWVPGMAIDIGIFVIHPAVLGILKKWRYQSEWMTIPQYGKTSHVLTNHMFGNVWYSNDRYQPWRAENIPRFKQLESVHISKTTHNRACFSLLQFMWNLNIAGKITNHMGDLNGWMVFPFNMDQTLWFPGLEFRPLRKCPYTKKSSWPIFRYPVNDVVLVNSNHPQPISNDLKCTFNAINPSKYRWFNLALRT